MANTISLDMNRKLTEWFINDDPTVLTLKSKVESRVGGVKKFTEGPQIKPQTVKVIYPGGDGIYVNAEGTTRRFDFIIVGLHTADLKVGYYWEEGDQRYTIEYIMPYNGYEVKVGGVTHGFNPDHG